MSEMNVSDTPRTDKLCAAPGKEIVAGYNRLFYPTVDADFARQLERELNAAVKERDAIEDELMELDDLTGDIKPDEDSDASGTVVERVRALLEMSDRFKKERGALKQLCVNVHDKLLRGAADIELLEMLQTSWRKPE